MVVPEELPRGVWEIVGYRTIIPPESGSAPRNTAHTTRYWVVGVCGTMLTQNVAPPVPSNTTCCVAPLLARVYESRPTNPAARRPNTSRSALLAAW